MKPWVITAFVVGGLLLAGSLQAKTGATWQSAQPIHLADGLAVVYGRFGTQSDSTIYQLSVDRPSDNRIEIAVPLTAAAEFMPRLVVYQPDSITLGPPLPMDQPPNTLATVYPGRQPEERFEVFTQISYRQTLVTSLRFDRPGTYYLAVYNPSVWPGRFRLMIDQGQSAVASWSDAWQLPNRWWSDQAFAGLTWRTLLTPLLFAALVMLVIEQLRYYHLHHLAVAPVRKKKSRVTKK